MTDEPVSNESPECLICGRPGHLIHLPSSGRWTSTDAGHGIPVCDAHDPHRPQGYDLARAQRVAEHLSLLRQDRTRRPEE